MGKGPRFSIITPTWNRADGRLQRCLASVQRQTFEDFEHIIVDDGSTDDTVDVVEAVDDPRVRYVYIEHQGRVIARNAGMERARGQWQLWLDSDDALDPMYLATVDYYARQKLDTRLWCIGAVVHGVRKNEQGVHLVPVWTKLRQAWMPPVDTNGCHSLFNSGKVGTGMFIYHKSCLAKTGLMPPWENHNEVADELDEWLGFPRGTTGYGINKSLYPKGHVGNPWGCDHAMFQKLCLSYKVELIPACLYIHYIR